MEFNIYIYLLAFILGTIVGFSVAMAITMYKEVSFEKEVKDGYLYIKPKPTHSTKA